MDDREFIELHGDDDGDRFEYKRPRPISPFKVKLIFWSTIIGGIAVGTALFLMFLTLFIYFFVPIILIASIWALVKYMTGSR